MDGIFRERFCDRSSEFCAFGGLRGFGTHFRLSLFRNRRARGGKCAIWLAGSSIWGTRTTPNTQRRVGRARSAGPYHWSRRLGTWSRDVSAYPPNPSRRHSLSQQSGLAAGVCARLNISITCPAASLRGLIIYRLGAAEFSARIAPPKLPPERERELRCSALVGAAKWACVVSHSGGRRGEKWPGRLFLFIILANTRVWPDLSPLTNSKLVCVSGVFDEKLCCG